MNKFKIHIGDWSSDGHGMEEVFYVQTKAKLESFRDAYVEFNEKYPLLNLEKMCNDYDDCSISPEQAKLLKKLGFKSGIKKGSLYVNPEDLAQMMMWACNLINPKLDYEFMNQDVPTFHNYGYDKKGRHIRGPGYGCFSL